MELESWILENPRIGIRIGISHCGIGIGVRITSGRGIIYNSDANYVTNYLKQLLYKIADRFIQANETVRAIMATVTYRFKAWQHKLSMTRLDLD